MATLASLADILLDDATGPDLLHDTLDRYRDLLLSASGLDLGDEDSLHPYDTGHGMAIGATWAALCIDDELRTQRFVAGLHLAVSERLAQHPGPVHVLYAGTGPFATLALPLMTRFTPEQLQFTFLEINTVSYRAVRQLLRELDLEAYVQRVVQTDASTYAVEPTPAIDILLTETMQYSLIDEMQVSIALNLLAQLPPTALMVPERIELRLGLLEETPRQSLLEDLGELLVIDRASLKAYVRQADSTDFPTVRLSIPAEGGLLAIRTGITTYGPYNLADYESGLTNPDIIGRFPDEEGTPEYLDFTYQLDPTPFLRMRYPEATPAVSPAT
ncbi:hypothetical protein CGL56_06970 [Neolewinella marina]|uniref:Phytanoyl-CoA dioxygenase n=2 Tax=Neolewinella marina TaxID=438751 RepID=A0A2G0CGT8_9BACT|nr:hypothetical protein CGL56_06970 [Neolewinella marina]